MLENCEVILWQLQLKLKLSTKHSRYLEIWQKNIQVLIIDGKRHWSKEIGLAKTIGGKINIISPAEGSWNINFEEGNDPNIPDNTFQENYRFKTVHIVPFHHDNMEKRFLVLNFKWNENLDATLRAHLRLNIH